jgi:hypothetical protein
MLQAAVPARCQSQTWSASRLLVLLGLLLDVPSSYLCLSATAVVAAAAAAVAGCEMS